MTCERARTTLCMYASLTVISMRPAGLPPMVMSKKTTGFDILWCCRGIVYVC